MKRHSSEGVALRERGRGLFPEKAGSVCGEEVLLRMFRGRSRSRFFVVGFSYVPFSVFAGSVFFPAGKCFGRKDEFCVLRRMGEAPCLPDGGRQGKCARHTSVAGRGRKVKNFVYRRVTVCFNGRTKSSCRRLSAGLRASVVRRRGGGRSVLPVAIFVRHPHGRSGESGIRPDAGRVGECRGGTTCGRKDFCAAGIRLFCAVAEDGGGMTTEERIVPVSPCRCTRQRKTPKVARTFPLCAGGAASGTDGAGKLTMTDGCGSLPPCVPVTVGENTCRFAERFGRMKGRGIFALGG